MDNSNETVSSESGECFNKEGVWPIITATATHLFMASYYLKCEHLLNL